MIPTRNRGGIDHLRVPVVRGPLDERWVDLLQVGDTEVSGVDGKLMLHDIDSLLDSFGSVHVGIHLYHSQ